jgi:proteasome lid subunit RPN8/RPN11
MLEHLLFSHPKTEREFKRLTNRKQEVGGWVFCGLEPYYWPTKYPYGQVKKLFGGDPPMFINAFMLVPNDDSRPQTRFNTWDWKKVKAVVNRTSSAYGIPTFFHTHPNGNPELSGPDIAFAGAHLQHCDGFATMIVVTHKPFRLWPYDIRWGSPRAPDAGDIWRGKFYSWRTKLVRNLSNGIIETR